LPVPGVTILPGAKKDDITVLELPVDPNVPQQFPFSASIGKISNDIEHAVGPICIFTFSSQ
jgi:hypothetical protein